MKKKLLIIALTIFTFTTISAQKKIDFGINSAVANTNKVDKMVCTNINKISFGI